MRTLLIVLFVGVAVVANAQPWSDELETKAKNGDVAAQMSVAEAYYVGDGIAQDRKKAARWYYEATLQGHAEAKAMLYSFYSKELEKLAKDGDAQAQFKVGEFYFVGDGDLKPNAAKAAKWYDMAMSQGHAEAKVRLYSFYSKELEMVAEGGDLIAQITVGDHYLNGVKVEKSTSKAAKWYNRATLQGSEKAKAKLFSFYNAELKNHAENGYADAQYALGVCYQYGYEVDGGYEEAAKWYEKAAKSGNKEANDALYDFYNKELERRAMAGDAKAQYGLGLSYLNGVGVAKNVVEAEWWLSKGILDSNVRAFYLGKMVAAELVAGQECDIKFKGGSLKGRYNNGLFENATLLFENENGVTYIFTGDVAYADNGITNESYYAGNKSGRFNGSSQLTLKKGGVLKTSGALAFRYELSADMKLKITTYYAYSQYRGAIADVDIVGDSKILSSSTTLSYKVEDKQAYCEELEGFYVPVEDRQEVKIIEVRVFMYSGDKNLANDKLYTLKNKECVAGDGSKLSIIYYDNAEIKEISYSSEAKSVMVNWDNAAGTGRFSREFNDTCGVIVGKGELLLPNGDSYKGDCVPHDMNQLLGLVELDSAAFVFSRFVDSSCNGTYYFADGTSEGIIGGRLEHIVREEEDAARIEEERRQAEEEKRQKEELLAPLYKKWGRKYIDMLYDGKACKGMAYNMIEEFFDYTEWGTISYGHQGRTYLGFIEFYDGNTYYGELNINTMKFKSMYID